MLIRAIIILILMLLYKWLAHKLNIKSLSVGPLPETRFDFVSKRIDVDKKISKFVCKPIFDKYPLILDIIYIILRYNPLL
jgi:hypothetical protein